MRTTKLDNLQVRPPLPATDQKQSPCFMVYYDGGRASIAALNSALDLQERNTVILAVACELSRRHPLHLKNRAEVALAGAVTNAARRGVSIRTRVLTGHDLGRALVECAAEYGADIIFWGIERAEVEKGLNRAAEYVLKFAPSKVVLVGV